MDQPLALRCGRTLNNRLCKVATSEHLGDARSNDATPLLTALYGRWAAGGWGLVITGNVMVDRRALEAPRNVVFDDATDTKRVSHWARSAKSGGALVLVQLSHPGRQSPIAASWRRPRSCSSRSFRLGGVGPQLHRTPVTMTTQEVDDLIKAFGRAARIAVRSGFDGVQVHAAHGYLLSQFLGASNDRNDAYGSRTRLLVDVCRACRAAIGPNGVLSVKVNASDFDGAHDDAARLRTVLEILDDDPLVRLDLAEVSGGTYEAGVACLGASADFPGTGPRLKFAPHVSELRRSTSLKAALMLAGGVSDRSSASDALRVADVAGVARAACVDAACASKWLHDQSAVTLKPPKFGEMPSWLGGRRVWVPGLNYGWHQRQLQRLAQGRDAIVLSHWPFLLWDLPRALLFEPARWPPWRAPAVVAALYVVCKICS